MAIYYGFIHRHPNLGLDVYAGLDVYGFILICEHLLIVWLEPTRWGYWIATSGVPTTGTFVMAVKVATKRELEL